MAVVSFQDLPLADVDHAWHPRRPSSGCAPGRTPTTAPRSGTARPTCDTTRRRPTTSPPTSCRLRIWWTAR